MACTGDATQVCGAGNRINLFWSGVPTANPGVEGFVLQGCWTDSVGNRSLTHAVRPLGGGKNNTIDNCVNACIAGGYILAGAEYSGECFCDNTYHFGGPASDQTTCNMACKGNVTEYCGGSNRLSLYSLGGVAPVQYAAPLPPAPTTTSSSSATDSTTPTSSSSTTSTSSTSTSSTSSVTDAPTPPSSSDSQPTPTDTPTTSSTTSTTSTSLTTSITSTSTTSASTSTTSTTSSSTADPVTTSSTTSSTTTTITPTPISTPFPSWTYRGCYIDNNNDAGRLLPLQQPDSTTLTIESCINACSAAGYSIAGVEFGDECWCGNELADGATKASVGIARSKCHSPCTGDGGESCGGPWFLEVYGFDAGAA
ncbi:hypothetical protein LTR95_002636 [Oleoguttula sp. CCFEE 5521]